MKYTICCMAALMSIMGIPYQVIAQVSNQRLAEAEFTATIQPLLQQYCMDCHPAGAPGAIDFLGPSRIDEMLKHRGLFATVVEQLESGAMPPGDDQQLGEKERSEIVEWFRKTLDLKPTETDRIAPYVVEVFEDRKGNLWLGTVNNGVARYDGQNLTYFGPNDGLPSNAVVQITEDTEGNLWAATQDGLCRFDGKRFQRMGSAEGLPERSRPSPDAIASAYVDRLGRLWTSVGQKIYQYDGTRFNEFKTPVNIPSIVSYAISPGRIRLSCEDKEGNLWFATDGDGAYKFDGTAFTHFTQADGLCSNNVTNVLVDQKGNVWFTCIQSFQPEMTGDGGLCRYDGESFTTFPDVKGMTKTDLYSIYETRGGDIWIGATGVGIYRFDGQTFTLFDKSDRPFWLRYFGTQAILQDRAGTLWFGMSGGLFQFDGEMLVNVAKSGPWKRPITEPLSTNVKDQLVVPEDWSQETIDCPSSFASTMAWTGTEHLRLPPQFGHTASEWFLSYLFAIQFSKPTELSQQAIADQLLLYYRGLAAESRDRAGKVIDTSAFSIKPDSSSLKLPPDEYAFVMQWQEPFAGGTALKQNLRVKVLKKNTEHGVLFVCTSPQNYESEVWSQMLELRLQFENRGSRRN